MNSVISPDDHWVLWTALLMSAAASIYLEQKNKIAAKLTGPVLALGFGMLLSNTNLLPTKSRHL